MSETEQGEVTLEVERWFYISEWGNNKTAHITKSTSRVLHQGGTHSALCGEAVRRVDGYAIVLGGAEPSLACAECKTELIARVLADSRASVVAPQGDAANDAIGLNLLRQLVGRKNALRTLGVFPCNNAEHLDVDCKCFWEQCEAWAKQDAERQVVTCADCGKSRSMSSLASRDTFVCRYCLSTNVTPVTAPVSTGEPIDIVLFCPRCGTQHVDAPEDETTYRHRMEAFGLVAEPQDHFPARWTNPPHKSHLCHNCYAVWRPADVPTNGVAQIQTRGKEDNTWTNSAAVPAATSTTPVDPNAEFEYCPSCGGELDTGFECKKCGQDWRSYVVADEVQRRMGHVVETAVEWHQAGREGGEWLEAADKLGAAIESLLELRATPAATPPPAVTPTPDSIRRAAAQAAQDLYALGWLRAAPAKANEAIIASLLRHLPVVTEAGEQECELERVLSLLISYGAVHTVNGVTYPEGSHAAALKAAERIRDWLRAGNKIAAPPSASAAIRAAAPIIEQAARDVVNELLNVPRFIRNPESTIIEIEKHVAAILSRYFGKGETDKSFVNEFTEATIEAHVGYHHEKTFHDCDYAVCAKRREMIGALHAAPAAPSPGEPLESVDEGSPSLSAAIAEVERIREQWQKLAERLRGNVSYSRELTLLDEVVTSLKSLSPSGASGRPAESTSVQCDHCALSTWAVPDTPCIKQAISGVGCGGTMRAVRTTDTQKRELL